MMRVNYSLLTGRHIAAVIVAFYNIDRTKYSFTAHTDMYVLAWAGDTPDQMETVLRDWDMLVANIP